MRPLATDLSRDDVRPYFMWDADVTVGELRRTLASAGADEKAMVLGRILREARDTDVWCFTTLAEVRRLFPRIRRYLGRRRAFWDYLMSAWNHEPEG
jgi:hypothetical protein